jgi:hypothetical protein
VAGLAVKGEWSQVLNAGGLEKRRVAFCDGGNGKENQFFRVVERKKQMCIQ